MTIKIGSNTFNNGGTAKYNTNDLKSIKWGSAEVWKKQMSLTGGSVSWNNTTTSQTKVYCTWTGLGGFSTLTIPFSGSLTNSCNTYTSDSCTVRIQLKFNDNTTKTIATYSGKGTAFSGSTTFTVDISGYSDSQLSSVKVQAYGTFSYSDATNRYTYNNTTVGTSTAS